MLFAGTVDDVCSLPSVTLCKSFAECFSDFAECPWHVANLLFPVVFVVVVVVKFMPLCYCLYGILGCKFLC